MESQNSSQRMDNGPDNVPPNMHPTAYFYPDQDTQYGMRYQPQLGTYPVPGVDLQPSPFHHHQNLGIVPSQQYHHYTSSPAQPQHSLSASPPPPSPEMYDPLSPPLSGSDASADAFYHHSNSSAGSRPGSRSNSLVHRTNTRYHPSTPSPTSSSGRPRRGRSRDSDDDDDMGIQSPDMMAHNRKEATRRQRIEAEQRRRDELRDGYAKLKDVLPVSNLKSSKVSLLERATNYIVEVERTNHELRERLQALQEEVNRLRSLNEKISFVSTENAATSSPGRFETRPISPPPDGPPGTARRSQEPMTSTPTPSEHGV